MTALVLLVAVIGGIAIALQGQFVGVIDQRLGTTESVFVTYASGGIAIALIIALLRGGNLTAWRTLPWYSFTAGLLGLVIIGSLAYSVGRLGLVSGLTAVTVSQFVFGVVIDRFGWFGAEIRALDATRIGGIALLLIGGWLVLR